MKTNHNLLLLLLGLLLLCHACKITTNIDGHRMLSSSQKEILQSFSLDTLLDSYSLENAKSVRIYELKTTDLFPLIHQVPHTLVVYLPMDCKAWASVLKSVVDSLDCAGSSKPQLLLLSRGFLIKNIRSVVYDLGFNYPVFALSPEEFGENLDAKEVGFRTAMLAGSGLESEEKYSFYLFDQSAKLLDAWSKETFQLASVCKSLKH